VLSTYAEHSAPITKVIFNPEDFMFASCSVDKTAKYFTCDESKGKYQYVSSTDIVTMPITAIDFNLDGSLLCLASTNILRICDMKKSGVLIESLDSSWKNVQDILWCSKGIKGLAVSGEDVSVWFCYLNDKKSDSNTR
jgi:WD40 repeat protein